MSLIASQQQRDRVFICYSHSDAEWKNRLTTILKPLERSGTVDYWNDGNIASGTKWRTEIATALKAARVAVLLVSPDFLASDFIHKQELPPLLEAAAANHVTILWVALKASLYKETEIENYQAANDPARPLDSLPPAEANSELVRVAEQIKEAFIRGGVLESMFLTPTQLSTLNPQSARQASTRVLGLAAGGLSLWVYLTAFDTGVRLLENNRYIIAHATSTKESYRNVFSCCRGPINFRSEEGRKTPAWKLWLVDGAGSGKVWHCVDSDSLKVGWHHFLVRWDHERAILELLVDHIVVIHAEDYKPYWPAEASEKMTIGCWPSLSQIHVVNTSIWRAQVLQGFPADGWIARS
jgi:hypothetical protein